MSARDRRRAERRAEDNDDEPDGRGDGVGLGVGFGGGGGDDDDSGGRDPSDPSDAPSATPDPGGSDDSGGGGRDPTDPSDAPSATPDPGGSDSGGGGGSSDPRNAPSATPAPGGDDGGRDAGDQSDAPSATPDPGAGEQGLEAGGAADRIVDAAAELEQDVVERYPSLDGSDVRVEREGNQLTAELTESGRAAFREEATDGRDPSNPADAPSASGAMPSGDAGASITIPGSDDPAAGTGSSGPGPQGSNGSTGGADSRDGGRPTEGGDVRLDEAAQEQRGGRPGEIINTDPTDPDPGPAGGDIRLGEAADEQAGQRQSVNRDDTITRFEQQGGDLRLDEAAGGGGRINRDPTDPSNEDFGDIPVRTPDGDRLETDLEDAEQDFNEAFLETASATAFPARTARALTTGGVPSTSLTAARTDGAVGQVPESLGRAINPAGIALDAKEIAEFGLTQPQRLLAPAGTGGEQTDFGQDAERRVGEIASSTQRRASDDPAEFGTGAATGLLAGAGLGRAAGSVTRRASGGRIDLGSDATGRVINRASESFRRFRQDNRGQADPVLGRVGGGDREPEVELADETSLATVDDARSQQLDQIAFGAERRAAETRRESDLEDVANDYGDRGVSTRDSRGVSGQEGVRTASDGVDTSRSGPTRGQREAFRGARSPEDLGLSPRERQLAAQADRPAADLRDATDLSSAFRRRDGATRSTLEARTSALTDEGVGALGGSRGRQRDRAGVGAGLLPDDAADSRNRSGVGVRSDLRSDTDVASGVDTRLDARSDLRADTRLDGRQDTRTDLRSDTRQDTRVDTRIDTRTDTRQDTRVDLRGDSNRRRRTPGFDLDASSDSSGFDLFGGGGDEDRTTYDTALDLGGGGGDRGLGDDLGL